MDCDWPAWDHIDIPSICCLRTYWGGIVGVLALIETDTTLRQAMSLSGLLIGGNVLGIALLLTSMFRSFIGSCVLVAYELAFLVVSFMFLSLDYSFAIGVVVYALLYVANVRRIAHGEVGQT